LDQFFCDFLWLLLLVPFVAQHPDKLSKQLQELIDLLP